MVRRNSVPPHIRRAIRTALGVFISCAIGYALILPIGHMGSADDLAKAGKWAAITCVVVTVPVMGKVVQVSVERALGTVIGGCIGYGVNRLGGHIYNNSLDGWVMSTIAAAFAYTCVIAAQRLSLDVSAKLCTITFLLVSFGGMTGSEGALGVAIYRISGILLGVLLSVLLSIIIMPRSASLQAVWELKAALDCLVKLGDICWKTQQIFRDELLQQMTATAPLQHTGHNASDYIPLPANDLEAAAAVVLQHTPSNVSDTYHEEAENRLNDLYNRLSKCKENIQVSASEILVGVHRGRWCFLPGSSCLKRKAWRSFEKDMDQAATNVRKLSRLLWMMHINFEEGFDGNMRALLKQQYPEELFPQMIKACNGVLSDIASVWPNGKSVPRNNLNLFLKDVMAVVAIADFNRRRVLRHMCRYKQVGRTVGPAEATYEPVTQLGKYLQQARSMAEKSKAPGDLLSEGPDEPVAQPNRINGDAPGSHHLPPVEEGAGERHASVVSSMHSQSSLATPSKRINSRALMISGKSSSGTLPNLTLEDDYFGSPQDAFNELDGVRISWDAKSGSGDSDLEDKGDLEFSTRKGSLHMRLPHTSSIQVAMFPETSEGHVSQVRWYSFQFLLEELAEQLGATVTTIDHLLERIQAVEENKR